MSSPVRARTGERGAARGVAVLLAVASGAWILLPYNVPLGAMLAAAMVPVWLPVLRRFRLLLALTALCVVAVVSGVLLSWAAVPMREVLPSALVERSAMLIGLIAVVGALVWARGVIGSSGVAIAFGVGLVVGVLPDIGGDASWRFTYSIPVTVLALAISARRGHPATQLAVITALVVVGALNGSRSNTAMLALAATVVVWQWANRSLLKGRRRAGNLATLLLLGVAIFFTAQAAILEGFFGEAAQSRSEQQIAGSGSLLLGGRPELAASIALITDHPLGLGSGTVASSADVISAKTAMLGIGYDPDNGYVNRYLFGSAIELHSLAGDFWVWFGLPGLAVCATIAVIVALGIDRQLRMGTASALVVYLAARFAWDLAFSPALSSVKLLPLTLALLAVPVAVRAVKHSSARTRAASREADVAAARTATAGRHGGSRGTGRATA
ncbi:MULTISPECIES: hypothetical protein [Microbacterium]|uniref:hypothetical protein n=1 Tax=Microbacterium TaxID=33882 RepID=UPI00214BE8D6|nr:MULTISPECIES: hypothetical protein [unclassified Microbacterium]MCR2814121.1 hypothetical protein [Microbacterium sp. zg.Y1084]MDL5487728.1 hypothetical protein [Microbacterium sp. zg-Y1211]